MSSSSFLRVDQRASSPLPQSARKASDTAAAAASDEPSASALRRTASCRVVVSKEPKRKAKVAQQGGASSSSSVDAAQCSFGRLTPSQVAVLRRTWRHISGKGIVPTMKRVFQKLESRNRVVEAIFYQAAFLSPNVHVSTQTVAEHARLLVGLLDELIDQLDKPNQARKTVQRVGAKHAALKEAAGFRADLWELVGEAAVETIPQLDGVYQSKEATKAWMLLIACLVDELRFGFEQECRQSVRRASYDESAPSAASREARAAERRARSHSNNDSLMGGEDVCRFQSTVHLPRDV